ncbi:hypothetical protein EXIGLDRAFT_728027, partial [Exidia glandulosa HHB12029]
LVLFCSCFVVFVWLLLAICGRPAEGEASDQIEKGQSEMAQCEGDVQEAATTRDSAIRLLFMVWCTAVILLSIAGQVFFFLPQDDQPVTVLKRLSVIKFMFVHQFLSVVSATLLIFSASLSIFVPGTFPPRSVFVLSPGTSLDVALRGRAGPRRCLPHDARISEIRSELRRHTSSRRIFRAKLCLDPLPVAAVLVVARAHRRARRRQYLLDLSHEGESPSLYWNI